MKNPNFSNSDGLADKLYDFALSLSGIPTSIAGEGQRLYHRKIMENFNFDFHCHVFFSGEKVFDWVVPHEWVLDNASLCNLDGSVEINLMDSPLRIASHSDSVSVNLSLKEIKETCFTDPSRPDAILYSTMYYSSGYGFSLKYNELNRLKSDSYKLNINARKKNGYLSITDAFIAGSSNQEIVISSYTCHPYMANDSISGVTIAAFLHDYFFKNKHLLNGYSLRTLFLPETIGSIAYLSEFGPSLRERVSMGLVVTCVGDDGHFNYKKSFTGVSDVDRLFENRASFSNWKIETRDYKAIGSDERQYCSPGFRLPFGVLTRTPYGEFPQYHTSLDNYDFISGENLENTLQLLISSIISFVNNRIYYRTNPNCEPFMSKYGLYRSVGGAGIMKHEKDIEVLMTVLSLCDGKNDLIEISNKCELDIYELISYVNVLLNHELIYSDDNHA